MISSTDGQGKIPLTRAANGGQNDNAGEKRQEGGTD